MTTPRGDRQTRVGDQTASLRAYLDASPSPYHAVATSAARLRAAGFGQADETADWTDAGRRSFVIRDGTLVAWSAPSGTTATLPFRIVGAHTDSPGLRIKPRPDTGLLGWRQLAVEVYGGPLLNSWLDRDLGVAGRVVLSDGSSRLLDVAEPIARVAQLAVHLDRDVNDKGLVLDRQQHLTPIWGTGDAAPGDFSDFAGDRLGVPPASIGAWDLQLYDVTPAAVIGADRSLLASGRLDNQLSCWAATAALVDAGHADQAGHVSVIALFDHEEVGSESSVGAAGPLLGHVLERICAGRGGSRSDFLRACAGSTCISSDNAHAVHPNYPERHEPGHRPLVNGGPALKVNASQRYATNAVTATLLQRACERAGVPWQVFASRNNMPCGTTIGPITASRLGIETVDVGVPQLSMHSAREVCGVDDPGYLARALTAYLSGA
jgi:aspartyl aminopeptidase